MQHVLAYTFGFKSCSILAFLLYLNVIFFVYPDLDWDL